MVCGDVSRKKKRQTRNEVSDEGHMKAFIPGNQLAFCKEIHKEHLDILQN